VTTDSNDMLNDLFACISVDETAPHVNLSKRSAWDAVHRGEIPALRFGRRVVVPLPALALTLLGVKNLPEFLRDLGINSLPALVNFISNVTPNAAPGPGGRNVPDVLATKASEVAS
jgi:hypothetical protein